MPPRGTKVIGRKKCPPMTAELEAAIRKYFAEGKNDVQITELLLEHHIDRTHYSLSAQSFRTMRRGLGLESVRGQKHTVDSIHELMLEHRERHANSGVSDARNLIRVESKGVIRVPRSVLVQWSRIHEPDKVIARRSRITPKKPFVSSGINEVWCMDQHDKWGIHGAWLHVGLDVFSGFILWLKVWTTNKNPRLICQYYLEALKANSGHRMPLLTQSDPGTENFGVANAQTTLRQAQDPELVGSTQHMFSPKHGNIKPEQFWSGMRKRFSPDMEALIMLGVDSGVFDKNSPEELLTFQFLFIPLIQTELDNYRDLINTSLRRANRLSTLPNAPPVSIYEHPTKYGGLDFKLSVPQEDIDHVRKLYAPPDDPVFQFLPEDFARHARRFYAEVGGEPIQRANVWFYYSGIIERFRNYELSMIERQEILRAGHIFNLLLEHSRKGSAPDEVWGYKIQPPAGAIQEYDVVGNQQDMEELDAVDMSDEEIVEDDGVGHDW